MSHHFRTINGRTCCKGNHLCAKCAAAAKGITAQGHDVRIAARTASSASHDTTDYTPPDPYAAAIALRREADATPESRFAERYTANRLKELEAEYAAAGNFTPPRPTRVMSAAELAQYAPPNPYAKETR